MAVQSDSSNSKNIRFPLFLRNNPNVKKKLIRIGTIDIDSGILI